MKKSVNLKTFQWKRIQITRTIMIIGITMSHKIIVIVIGIAVI